MGGHAEKSVIKTHFIAIVAFVILTGPREARAVPVPVNSNSIVQDGIEYYIETPKIVYDLGEDVEILYRITNLTDEEFRIRGPNPKRDIVVATEEEDNWLELWKWSWFQVGPAGPAFLDLEPGEATELSDYWPQTDWNGTRGIEDDFQVLPGKYRISGVLHPADSTVSVDITVVPEPTSIVLLCAGIALLRLKRTR